MDWGNEKSLRLSWRVSPTFCFWSWWSAQGVSSIGNTGVRRTLPSNRNTELKNLPDYSWLELLELLKLLALLWERELLLCCAWCAWWVAFFKNAWRDSSAFETFESFSSSLPQRSDLSKLRLLSFFVEFFLSECGSLVDSKSVRVEDSLLSMPILFKYCSRCFFMSYSLPRWVFGTRIRAVESDRKRPDLASPWVLGEQQNPKYKGEDTEERLQESWDWEDGV